VGVEWREDEYHFLPGATDLAGEYGPDSCGITEGRYDLTEFFAEVRVPLLADKAFAKKLVSKRPAATLTATRPSAARPPGS
jgi:iron complex outermembrane receptor protein